MAKMIHTVRNLALGAATLGVTLLCVPSHRAYAQFGDILGFLTSTVTGIGTSIAGVNSSVSSIFSLQQNTVFPLSNLSMLQSNGMSIIGSYRPWMSSVYSAPINSALTPTAQSFESMALGGIGGGGSLSGLANQFIGAYGSLPSPVQADTAVRQQVDLSDTAAQDSVSMAVLADSNATQTIQNGNSLESQAMTATAGTAPIIEATALAYELQSLASEHKMYASQLRAYAAQLGDRGASVKTGANAVGNVTNAVSNLNGVHP